MTAATSILTRHRTWFGLGSNQGDRAQYLATALRALRQWPELRDLRCSSVYETAYVGPGEQADYWNLCCRAEVELDGPEILGRLTALEREAGRPAEGHMAPRTLDLDLLVHRGQLHSGPPLTLPHPRLHLRRFVLEPLAELDPGLPVGPHPRPVRDWLGDEAIAAQRVRRLGAVEDILGLDAERRR